MKKFCMVMIIVALVPVAMVHAKKGVAVYDAWQNLRAPAGTEAWYVPLFENPNYPFKPDVSYEFTNMNGPRDYADNYGAKLYAYVTVPASGSYTFYICSDDQSELNLSTEGWPDTKKRIARVDTYIEGNPPVWNQYPDQQQSASIALTEGQIIYLEGIMREGGGSDNIFIGWQGPGMSDIFIIPGTYLSTVHPKSASDPVPANGAELIPTNTQLSWIAPSDVNDVATYKVFLGNEPNLLTMPQIADVGTATTANPGTLQTGKTYYWRVETTHSNNGKPFTVRGNFWQFTTVPATPVIKTQPQDAFLMAGDTATFTCIAESETSKTYTWFKVASPDEQVGTGETLTIPDAQTEAQYYCNVTNAGGTVKSNTVSLKIKRLIAYYPFEDNANDASGFGPNGTWSGTEAYDTGMVGKAALLDGSTSYVVFGSVGVSGNMPRTVAAWAKPSVPTAQITVWTNIFGFTSTTATGSLSFDLEKVSYNGEGYGIHCYGWERMMKTPIDMDWHFLAATYDGTTISWFFDGARVGSEAFALSTEDLVHMGKRAHDGGGFWPGLVDDARIYNYALDAYQIAQLYVDVKPGETICPEYKAGDINRDCKVNMEDFAEMARIWMECGRIPVSECVK